VQSIPGNGRSRPAPAPWTVARPRRPGPAAAQASRPSRAVDGNRARARGGPGVPRGLQSAPIVRARLPTKNRLQDMGIVVPAPDGEDPASRTSLRSESVSERVHCSGDCVRLGFSSHLQGSGRWRGLPEKPRYPATPLPRYPATPLPRYTSRHGTTALGARKAEASFRTPGLRPLARPSQETPLPRYPATPLPVPRRRLPAGGGAIRLRSCLYAAAGLGYAESLPAILLL
jgi:hypothetical protein